MANDAQRWPTPGLGIVLRAHDWDGPDPATGAVVQHPDHGPLVVTQVAKGAGVGHWRLTCRVPQLIAWHP